MPPLVQELDECLLEVEPRRAGGLLEVARRSAEHALPVCEHDQLAGVAVGLLDVVGRVDDRRSLAREPQDELPQPRALARIACEAA